MPVTSTHQCDKDCDQLDQCRTLDEMYAHYLRIYQAKRKEVGAGALSEDIIQYNRAVFYSGAMAVFGLVEGNHVSMIAIGAMLELYDKASPL